MQTLNQIQDAFERYLKANKFNQAPAALYAPVNYILDLGGKRLRPAVLLMSHYLFKDDWERSLPAAMAVEVFHNFTLLHDDIMDAAPLRRGKPTVHEKFGLSAGILSGDVMMIYAYDYLLRLESQHLPEIVKAFNKMAIEVCEGQQMDMNFETRQDVSISEYLKMIELKTSVLVAAAMKIGALLAGASGEDAHLLYEFGKNLGIAFQLQDDVLDTYGDPAKFGKKTGGDIVQNKKTFLYLKALEVAGGVEKAELGKLYANPVIKEADKIESVMRIFNKLNIKGLAKREKEHFQSLAFESLNRIAAPASRKKLLEGFAYALMQREF